MLRLSHVNVKIAGADILRDVSLELQPKSFVALVGRNGAGKTTLMRAIMGLLAVSSGRVEIDGRDVTRLEAHTRSRSGVGYMPEDRRLVPDWTVEQNIRLPSWANPIQDVESKLERIYEQMPEVANFRDRKALQLSGGQQKLVALARAMMAASHLLILDEPFEGVAPALVQRLVDILSDLRRHCALSVLISESDGTYSEDLVDYGYGIERGRVTAPSI
jgi:branched-chain amino acid transport system ATP-binding protein